MPVALDEPPQVKVITSGGFTAAFDILGSIFEQATGIEVVTEYGSSMGGGPESIPVRLARGDATVKKTLGTIHAPRLQDRMRAVAELLDRAVS